MSLNVLTQGGGTGGESASIFITGLSETDTVTAVKDGKTVRGKWTQKKNSVVPDGYTQLEYIESTGTQWINSGIIPSTSTGVYVKTAPLTTGTGTVVGAITGLGEGYWGVTVYQSKWDVYWGVSKGQYGSFNTGDWHLVHLNYMNCGKFNVDGYDLLTLGSATITTNPVHIFRMNQGTYSDPQYYVGRIAELIFTVGTEITNNFVPAKRNSDGAVGMYDTVKGVFHANAGTGTFTAGKEIPQYISGHEITKIKEYGMYTLTATDGNRTLTKNVLVDAALEFVIPMNYILYLYNEGDECEDATGGWVTQALGLQTEYNVPQAPILTKNATNMVLSRTSPTAYACGIILPKNKIDFTGYKTINITVDFAGIASNDNCLHRGYFIKDKLGSVCNDGTQWFELGNSNPAETNKTLTGDISACTGLFVPYISIYSKGSLTIHKVWLE